MSVILSPRGNEASNMMKRFVRYEEAAQYFGIDETLIVAYAKVAGAVYQLSKIRLIKIEPLEDYMKHLTRVVPALCGMGMMMSQMTTTCFAAGTGTSAVTQPLDNLKTLVIAVIGAVGVIILAKNVMEFAQAYQQQDSSTMNSALKGIVAGVMMAGISTVLTFLGF